MWPPALFDHSTTTSHWVSLEKLAWFCEFTTTNCLSRLILPPGREPLGLGAQQRDAHIDPACASGSTRRTASADRSGSCAGIVGAQSVATCRCRFAHRLLSGACRPGAADQRPRIHARAGSKQLLPAAPARGRAQLARSRERARGDCVVGVASDFARERLVINLLVAGRKFSALALKGMLARVI
jgi:hypothetical protein